MKVFLIIRRSKLSRRTHQPFHPKVLNMDLTVAALPTSAMRDSDERLPAEGSMSKMQETNHVHMPDRFPRQCHGFVPYTDQRIPRNATIVPHAEQRFVAAAGPVFSGQLTQPVP
jgi:hypothetical protein